MRIGTEPPLPPTGCKLFMHSAYCDVRSPTRPNTTMLDEYRSRIEELGGELVSGLEAEPGMPVVVLLVVLLLDQSQSEVNWEDQP